MPLTNKNEILKYYFGHDRFRNGQEEIADATLRDMCAKHPRTLSEMLNVSGVGERKLQKYGQAFLDVLNTYE